MSASEHTFENRLKQIDDQLAAAIEDSSDIEIRDRLVDKGDLYLEFNLQEKFREFYMQAVEKSIGNAKKLELLLRVLHSYFIEN